MSGEADDLTVADGRLLDELTTIVSFAAAAILAARAGALDARTKADLSPVTNADVQAEEMLLAGLARIFPGVPVLAEESTSAGRVPEIGSEFLVLDPLDGTKEYVSGRPEYTVNIGLVAAGRPVLGILHAPALGRTYWGEVGRGAADQGEGLLAAVGGHHLVALLAQRRLHERQDDGVVVDAEDASVADLLGGAFGPYGLHPEPLSASEWRSLNGLTGACPPGP